jgi:hypothetical protein
MSRRRISRHARGALLLAVTLLLAFAPAAFGHGGNPDYRSVIDSVAPQVPGVEFRVLNYDADLQLVDRGARRVTIYGYEDEPYARILEDGTVQVNERSPATYLNDSRFATAQVPAVADPEAPARWKTVDESGTFIWHDHRMHYMSTATPPQVTDTGHKTKVFDYEIPIRVDARKGALQGTLYWVGSPSTSKAPFIVVGILILIGGGALVLIARRRRSADDGPSSSGGSGKEAW